MNGGGVSFRGLVENSGAGNATLAGPAFTINGSLFGGGHFASAGGGTLTVSNAIISTVTNNVVHRIGTVIYAGGGSYQGFAVAEGAARLGADNGLCSTSLVTIASSSTASLDLAGHNQTVAGIQRITGNTANIINSSASLDSTLTLVGTSSYSGLITDNSSPGSRIALVVNGGNLTLSGLNTYSAGTVVTNGTLRINTTTAAGTGPVAVQNGGTLGGNGTISGSATLDAGSTLSPGNTGVGTLTFNSNLTLAGNLLVEVDKSLAPSNDYVNVVGVLTNAGLGTLTVTNTGSNALVAGDSFKVFSKPLANGQALTIVGPAGVTFTNSLAADGRITVLVAGRPQLTFTNTGSVLHFTWDAGFKLQAQTNSLSVGVSNNWTDYPGGATSPLDVPVDVAQPGVFFRLINQ
jgi:autotransporter-associated beta strand protein